MRTINVCLTRRTAFVASQGVLAYYDGDPHRLFLPLQELLSVNYFVVFEGVRSRYTRQVFRQPAHRCAWDGRCLALERRCAVHAESFSTHTPTYRCVPLAPHRWSPAGVQNNSSGLTCIASIALSLLLMLVAAVLSRSTDFDRLCLVVSSIVLNHTTAIHACYRTRSCLRYDSTLRFAAFARAIHCRCWYRPRSR